MSLNVFRSTIRAARTSARPSSRFTTPAYITLSSNGRLMSTGGAKLADIDPSRLEVIRNAKPGVPPPSSSLKFGHTFTDHMLTIPWDVVSGWGVPKIQPYGPLQLEPSSTVLHYAQTVFEGMKAYRHDDGRVTLFRPDMNMKRMNRSATRIALPNFDGEAMLELIKQLIRLDKDWIPREPGHSLYVRPTLSKCFYALNVGGLDSTVRTVR
ncbi:hypothetical protein NMY22_g16417 [Coprinellus aureogranulatus]|nr:hypothetical protein NMY22_g16417 [Coprinellus aureogranulatus]